MTPNGRSRIGATLVAGLLLAGCATSGGTGAGTAPLSDKTIPVFNWALTAAPGTLDKTKNNGTSASEFLAAVIEPLERVSSTGTFTPNLAESVAQPDDTTLVYKLRSGVKFSDGAELTAQDVVWSIQYAGAPDSQTSASLRPVTSVAASGPLEVTVKVGSPSPVIRAALAFVPIQQAKFAQAHATDLGQSDAAPVGTGPYKVDQNDAQAVTLTRNPHYWGTKPAPDKIVFSFVPDDNARQLALRSNSVDGATISNLKSGPQWRDIPGATVYSRPSYVQNLLALDVSTAPFDDIHVRRAIAYAVDKAAVAKAGFGDLATPLQGLAPAGVLAPVAGSVEQAQDFLDSLPQYDFDLDKAKAELARSGHAQGFSVTLPYVTELPWQKLFALSLQQNLASLGVTVTPQAVTMQEWSAKFFQHELKGLVIGGPFGPTAPDPASLMVKLVGQENIGPQRINLSNWTSDAVEQALPVIKSAGPPATRWEATKSVLSSVADQVPYVPLFTENSAYVLRQGFGFAKKDIDIYDILNGNWIFQLKAAA